MNKSKLCYNLGLLLGIGLIVFGNLFYGAIVFFIGLLGFSIFAEPIEGDVNFKTQWRTKQSSEYEDEFEEYQHFKIVNKSIYGEQVKRRLNGEEGFNTPDKDCGLFNHEKRNVELRELRKVK